MKDNAGKHTRGPLPEGLPAEPQQSFDPAKSAVLDDRSEFPSNIHLHDTVPVLANWVVQAAKKAAREQDSTTPSSPDIDAEPGEALATFRLEQQIGRGGFGEVWEAVQVSLGRVVAVKRLRPDLLDRVSSNPGRRQALELSFHQEAVTTASLEHPNIVPIHDLGRDPAGRPVLAMKRLRGRTWEDLIRAEFTSMPVADFLGKHLPILVDVSQAVAFAHSRGVIHRDLKPSQVMVGEFGEVLLLDWGLAVAHDPELLATHAQAFAVSVAPTCESATNPAGTPAFMAPEQTEPTAANVGPWTDMFLLGGTLYYLLCGTAPHHTEDSAASFYRASEGIIDPPEKRNPKREVPAELSVLAMHAMAFRPTDRPGDVADFIARISDYLTGASKRREAVTLIADVERRLAEEAPSYRSLSECAVSLARAEGLWPGNIRSRQLGERTIEAHANVAFANGDYTLARQQAERLADLTLRSRLMTEIDLVVSANAKALRQRKHLLIAAGILAASFIGGSIQYALVLSESAERERKNAAMQEIANAQLLRQRESGERLITYMLGDLSGKLDATGRVSLMSDVAERALEFYDEQPEGDASPENTRQRISALRQIAFVLRRHADYERGRKTIDSALALAEPLVTTPPENHENLGVLADALLESSRLASVQGLTEREIADVNRSIDLATRANTLHPHYMFASTLTNGYIDRGETLQRTVGTQAGLDDYYSAMRTIEPWLDDPENKEAARKLKLGIESYIGSALAELGRMEEGVAYTMRAIDGTRDLLKGDPGNYSFRYDAVMLSGDLTSILQRLGRREEAFRYAELMVSDSEELVRRDPENINYSHWLGVACFSRGSAYIDEGKTDEALLDFERSLAQFERNVRESPNFVPSRDNLPPVLARTAMTYRLVGRNDEAVGILRKSVDFAKNSYEANPTDVGLAVSYTSALGQLGDVLATAGRPEEASPIQELAIRIHGEKVDRDPENMQLSRNFATLHARIAQTYLWSGQREKAEGAALKARELMEKIRASTPENVDGRREYCAACLRSGNIFSTTGDAERALQYTMEALDCLESLSADNPDNNSWYRELSIANNSLGWEKIAAGEPVEAERYFRRSMEVSESILQLSPTHVGFRTEVLNSRQGLAEVFLRRGMRDDALAESTATLASMQELMGGPPPDGTTQLKLSGMLDQRGRILDAMGRNAEARIAWTEALSGLAPYAKESRDPRFLDQWALLLLRLGYTEEAKVPIERLARMQILRKPLLDLMSAKGVLAPGEGGTRE